MPIESTEYGTTITGENSMTFARRAAIKAGLSFEVKCPGMKLTRGRSCSALAKEDLKANAIKPKAKKADLLIQYTQFFNDTYPTVESAQ